MKAVCTHSLRRASGQIARGVISGGGMGLAGGAPSALRHSSITRIRAKRRGARFQWAQWHRRGRHRRRTVRASATAARRRGPRCRRADWTTNASVAAARGWPPGSAVGTYKGRKGTSIGKMFTGRAGAGLQIIHLISRRLVWVGHGVGGCCWCCLSLRSIVVQSWSGQLESQAVVSCVVARSCVVRAPRGGVGRG